jgi:hypothetical protein
VFEATGGRQSVAEEMNPPSAFEATGGWQSVADETNPLSVFEAMEGSSQWQRR